MFEIIAHRGWGHRSPRAPWRENTLAAFRAAFDHGADAVECDLRLTHDQRVVVHHDSHLSTREVVASVNSVNLAADHPHIPLIDEVVGEFPSQKFIFELKEDADFRTVIDVALPLLRPRLAQYRFVSFSLDALRALKDSEPNAYAIFIATSAAPRFEPFVRTHHIRWALEFGLDELAGNWFTFLPGTIRAAQQAGLAVSLGLVNIRTSCWYARRHRVNSIYTDDLVRMKEYRDR